MLVGVKHSGAESVHELPRANGTGKILGDLIQKHCIDNNRSHVSTTFFSLGWPEESLWQHPLVIQADIIHLHWVSGLVSASCLAGLRTLGKPILWTLHDQRTFTGGCHYTSGCARFEKDCSNCPQLTVDECGIPAANLADQRHVLGDSGILIITPSRWMAECARRSAVLSNARIEVVPYGIDTQRFQAVPQKKARKNLALPDDDFLLLFGVDNAGEKRKGLRELFAVLETCGKDEDFRRASAERKNGLLCFGEVKPAATLPLPVRTFGRIRSDEALNSLYSAADLFLLPSLEDNLPNTVLESLCSGTPVGAFSSGGVPEMVVPGKTGFLAPTGDLPGLARIILDGANDVQVLRNMRQACRKHIETHFTYARHAQSCIRLYEEVLRAGAKGRATPAISAMHRDAGCRFETVFATALKRVFDNNPDVPLPPPNPNFQTDESHRRSAFNRDVQRLLKRAVKGSWPYHTVREALEMEFEISQDGKAFSRRLSFHLKRLLRRS